MGWQVCVSRLCAGAIVVRLMAFAPCAGGPPPCPDGACEQNCPVRPGQFGYYPTQWRRWPAAAPQAEKPGATPTPAAPARSVVPGVDEESPRRPVDAAPTKSAPAAAVHPAPVPGGDGRRLEQLAADADAARLADPTSRRAFTVRLVSAMLTEADPLARCTMLALASGFDTPEAAAIIAGALEDPDPRVRFQACQICAERPPADGIARLVRRAREDVDLGVRLRAVRSLGVSRDPAAIPPLVALLDDPDPAIRSRVMAALGEATGQSFGADAERWRKWAADPAARPQRWSLGTALRSLF